MRKAPMVSLKMGASGAVICVALLSSTAAPAQTGSTGPGQSPAQQAGVQDTEAEQRDIVVTGSRIQREGFDQPTPTTVIGDVELRQAARANIAQVLNDTPQFRPTVSPAVSVGNTSSGTAPVDLRGLGTVRTLTLLNGRRFVGDGNLNLIPSGLVERVEVVTGGASAAWGSNAVAGVVNIILDKDLKGLTLGASGGVSSRGDAARYMAEAKYGTSFAEGAGHFIAGVEYVNDRGIRDRNSRRNLGSTNSARVNPTSATDLTTFLVRDVNYTNQNGSGVIVGGVLNGRTFNADGTIRPFQGPNAQGIGGADAIGLYDDVYGASPFDRVNGYARLSYDISDANLWVEGLYGRAKSKYPFFPDLLLGNPAFPAPNPANPALPQRVVISASNPFVRPEIRAQLLAAGQASFTLGRVFNDIFLNTFDLKRENREVAVGVDGDLGGSWKYNAYGSYGEVESNELVTNSRIAANYAKAINAATNASGQIVCAVNADAIATNDDPACVPLNVLGSGVASPGALAYVRGSQSQRVLNKLTSFGFQIQGDLFTLPAGPLTVAVGVEGRKEEQTTKRDALTATPNYFGFQLYAQDFGGEFSVKEAFGEAAVPVFDIKGAAKLDLNGAVRYSDFSTSGGVTTWKVGGTLRLFDDLLFRATKSRDIRSPSIGQLFAVRGTNIGTIVDQDTAKGAGKPGYNNNPTQVFTFSGGNPDLDQERANTIVLGGSFSPSFFQGFNLSVDYYDIKIKGAIATLSGTQLTLACKNGNQSACDRVIRDPTSGTITTIFANAQNLAFFQTTGVDIEASYAMPLSRLSSAMDGTLRIRGLATYVDKFVQNDGITKVDFAGDVGNTVAQGLPHWRGTLSFTYQTEKLGLDARVRYVGGGKFNHLSEVTTVNGVTTGLINNDVDSRTYLDLGAQFKVTDRFEFYGNVNNVLDRKPPLSTTGPIHYDAVGTYFTFGARARF